MSEPVRFGRYSLIKRIAAGGMAEIYLAKQQGPGTFERSLVIKRMLPHLTEDPKFVQMFLDEAALAAHLTHPNIAQVLDFGEEEGSYFIALELIKGPDLRALGRAAKKVGKPVPNEVAIKIISQTCQALHYAHSAKGDDGKPLEIVHRDVSPQNILVSYDGVVKLVDFGIAKASTQGQQTEAGVVKGKFAYLSPEQVRTQKLDGRSDLYAAGLVLYELLALEQGLQGDGAIAIANAMEANIVPIEQFRNDLPPELLDVLNRALSKDRDDRQPNCHAFAEELEGLLVQWGVTVGTPDVARYVREIEVEVGVPLSAAAGTGASRVDLPAPDTSPGAQRGSRVASTPPRSKAIGADAEGEIHGNEPTRMPAQRSRTGMTGARPAIGEADTTLPPRARTGTTGSRPAVEPTARGRTGSRPAVSEADTTLPPRAQRSGFVQPESKQETQVRRTSGGRPAVQVAPEPEPEEPEVDPEADEPTPPPAPPPRARTGARPAVRPAERTPVPTRRRERDDDTDQKQPEKKGGGFLSGLFTFLIFAGMLGGGVYGVWWKILGPGKEPEQAPLSTELPKPKPAEPAKPQPSLLPPGAAGATGATGAEAKGETKPEAKPDKPETAEKGGEKPKAKHEPKEPKEPKSTGIEDGKAGLQVDCNQDAEVLLDGQSLGPVPYKGSVAPGAHKVLVQDKKHGLKRELALELAAGAWSKQSVEFQKGTLRFKAIPWANVNFGGNDLDKPTPTSVKAWEGTYEVVFTHEGKTEKREVTVKGGEEQEVSVDFSK